MTTARTMQLVGREVPLWLFTISAIVTLLHQGPPNFPVFLFPVLKKKPNDSFAAGTYDQNAVGTDRHHGKNELSMRSSRYAEASASRQMNTAYELDSSQHRGVKVQRYCEIDLPSSIMMESKDSIT